MGADGNASVGWDSPLAQRYRLDVLLGSGSLADVYRAEDIRLRRLVAVKMFRPDPDPAARSRFGEEARVLAQWSHPGLVSIFDAGIDDDRPYLVMQLVEGESLRCRLRAGPLAPAEVVRMGISLADAIDHVHSHGVAHQDVKPANVLLDAEDNVYLADCGAALAGAAGLTTVREIVGSGAYLAPEQVRGGQITPAVDVYALGLVLLECLTGEPTAPDVVGRARVRSRLTELLVTMSAADASQRPSPEYCADALRTLDPGTPMAELPTMVTTPAPPPPRPVRRAGPARRPGRFRTRMLAVQPVLPEAPSTQQAPLVRRRGRYLVGAGIVVAVLVALALMVLLGVWGPAVGHPSGLGRTDQPGSVDRGLPLDRAGT